MPAVPIPDSYWVVPGALLAGEYPGALSALDARTKLRKLIEGGVTCFIDLTQEDELIPYAPLLPELAPERCIHRRFSIRDMGVPTPAAMRTILDSITSALDAGHTVYVHCWGGIGRTGTVVGCYLIEQGIQAQAAIDEIARLRRGIPDEWRLSPETNEQRAFVRAWMPGSGQPRAGGPALSGASGGVIPSGE